MYAARGAHLVLVTATLGEAGKTGEPPVCLKEQLPLVREAELRAALEILGVKHMHLLGYRDKELDAAPPAEVRRQLVSVIRQHQPDIIITFDPNGSNLHRDHIAISRFTSDAVAAAADPRWFPELGPVHRVKRLLWTPPVPPWELVRVQRLEAEPGVDFAINIEAWHQRKADALRAHRSQHLAIDRIFFNPPNAELLLRVEIFRQAWGPRLPSRPLQDLFAGLD
jgi:LmbE family N-acetylglucosaminyl deacetylase